MLRPTALVVCAALTMYSAVARADYKDDIGFRLLQSQLGAGMPTGAGVPVLQAEGDQVVNGVWAFLPDPGNGEFTGKTITAKSSGVPGAYSGHATAVGQFFYGTVTSTAPGISLIDAYSADKWLGADFLRPSGNTPKQPLASAARVANHSWVHTEASANTDILRRLDWVIDRDEFSQVVGLNNGDPNLPLLSSAFNVIAVGRTTGEHGRGSVAVDSLYTSGRTRPDVVAPADGTSTSTPQVAALAALLVEVGQNNAGLSTDPVTQTVTSRSVGGSGTVIRNAARSEVIKAAVMAGASRTTTNTSTSDITDYRATVANQASNGLDVRFGAGQINIASSYGIITGGEQNSLQDKPTGNGLAFASGFDYDPHFGGLNGSNQTATYYLPMPATDGNLTAALVWNLKIHGGTSRDFDGTATFYNLDVELFDVTNPSNWVSVGYSRSTTDNTENLWLPLAAGREYALQVTRPGSQNDFDWDYALAWHTILVPWVDTDSDGVSDPNDNCTLLPNPGQCDSDGDGFGNRCDGDLNNNLFTNAQDYVDLRAQLGSPSPAPAFNIADLNCNGFVNGQDYVLFRTLLGPPPGPSGLVTGESP